MRAGNLVDSCKDDSNSHQYSKENWEDAEIKIPETGKNNDCELFYDTRVGDEWEKENDGDTLERRSCGDSSCNLAAKKDSVEKVDPVFYMDKNVMACDLPEIVVCYKENGYHVVKDICIDEGLPVQEKFLFGEEDSVKCSSNSNQCESEEADKVGNRNSKIDDSELCNDSNRNVEEDSSSNCNQELLIMNREVENLARQRLNSSEISLESETDENLKDEVATTEKILKKSLTLGDFLSKEDEQNLQSSHQIQEKETTDLKTEEPRKPEQKLSSVSTCNDSEKSETENRQENYLVMDSDEVLMSGFGETSFSGAEAVSISSHITYSGPVAFSGNLSVRSDASTTSGKSFAFPILQSEWNSSPVRMAKAEKRRRQKGWIKSLLCCKF